MKALGCNVGQHRTSARGHSSSFKSLLPWELLAKDTLLPDGIRKDMTSVGEFGVLHLHPLRLTRGIRKGATSLSVHEREGLHSPLLLTQRLQTACSLWMPLLLSTREPVFSLLCVSVYAGSVTITCTEVELCVDMPLFCCGVKQ